MPLVTVTDEPRWWRSCDGVARVDSAELDDARTRCGTTGPRDSGAVGPPAILEQRLSAVAVRLVGLVCAASRGDVRGAVLAWARSETAPARRPPSGAPWDDRATTSHCAGPGAETTPASSSSSLVAQLTLSSAVTRQRACRSSRSPSPDTSSRWWRASSSMASTLRLASIGSSLGSAASMQTEPSPASAATEPRLGGRRLGGMVQ